MKSLIEKKTLLQIYLEINKRHEPLRPINCFRARYVSILEDYCIFSIFSFANNNLPTWFKAIRLDRQNFQAQLPSNENNFALLSSEEEMAVLCSFDYNQLVTFLEKSY